MPSKALILIFLVPFALGSLAVQAASTSSLRVQVVDEQGQPVPDAIVEVRAGSQGGAAISFPWRMAMAQKDLQFIPGTLVVAKNATVAFPNFDKVRHSIYSFSPTARFQIDLYGQDQTRKQTFAKAGTVVLGCNIHDQMRGYIRVVDTPFASKSDGNGNVVVSGLPAGSATLVVWHPRLRAPNGELVQSTQLATGVNTRSIRIRLR